VIIGFLLLAVEYLVRYARDRPLSHKTGFARGPLEKKLKWMIIAVLFNVTCLFIRCAPSSIVVSSGLTHAFCDCVQGCIPDVRVSGWLEWEGHIHSSLFQCEKKNPLFAEDVSLMDPFSSIDVLDGGMVTLAMWTLNIFHPGLLLDLRAKAGKRDVDLAEEKAVESSDS
jgi:hypothetical protein